MADFNIFDPINTAPGLVPDTGALRQQWDLYLNDPKTQAALLSFGAQAAQPTQWGQTGFGHLMSSVAQGGAGVRQVESLDQKQQEADSKSTLRESQGLLAESRAANAGLAARNAEDRLGIARMREENLNERNRLGRLLQANRLYADYVKATQKANENEQLMRGRNAQIKPILSQEEWFAQNQPLMTSLGLTPGSFQAPAPGTGDGSPTVLTPPGGGTSAPNPPPQSGTGGGPPQPGQVVNGWRFRGGNPRDRNNWERVGG